MPRQARSHTAAENAGAERPVRSRGSAAVRRSRRGVALAGNIGSSPPANCGIGTVVEVATGRVTLPGIPTRSESRVDGQFCAADCGRRAGVLRHQPRDQFRHFCWNGWVLDVNERRGSRRQGHHHGHRRVARERQFSREHRVQHAAEAENRSARPSTSVPDACSGDMKFGVPTMKPVEVRLGSPAVRRASPKSRILTRRNSTRGSQNRARGGALPRSIRARDSPA